MKTLKDIEEAPRIEWNKKVNKLNEADEKILDMLKNGTLSKRKYNQYKKVLNKLWIRIWDYYPDKNPLMTEIYKKNFPED